MTRRGDESMRRPDVRGAWVLAVGWLLLVAHPASAVVSYGDWLRINGLLESYTAVNTESFSGTFLSMERNTFQLETEAVLLRKFGFLREVKFDSTVRPWWDPVLHLNTARYGVAAHDKILGTLDSIVGPVDFVVPVNPNSPRGAEPVFNDQDRFDREVFYQEYREILREAYFDITTTPFGQSSFGNTLFVRLGKQQVAWGKTDFFRLADIINPIDYQRHAFLELYDIIRMPQWMLHAVYNFGSFGPFSSLSIETDWNFDRPLGSKLGPGGAAYAHPFADEIRGFKTFYQEGIPNGTFAGLPFPVPPGVLGLRNSSNPKYELGNTQYGGRVQGVYEGITWSVDYWHGYNDLPTFRLVPSLGNPILNDNVTTLLLNPNGTNRKGAKIPLYDMRYYKHEVVSTSFDWPEDEWTQSVWRGEFSYVFNEHVNDTSNLDTAIQKTDIFRYVIGWDRPTFIRPLNPTRTFLLSAQSFLTHVLDHNGPSRGPGTIQDPLQVILTFLVFAFYHNDRLLPVGFAGYQFNADAILVGGWVQYLFTDAIDATLGGNSISGRNRVFDFGAGGGDPNALPPTGIVQAQSRIPWGPAKEGFGAWRQIDDFWLRVRYRF